MLKNTLEKEEMLVYYKIYSIQYSEPKKSTLNSKQEFLPSPQCSSAFEREIYGDVKHESMEGQGNVQY